MLIDFEKSLPYKLTIAQQKAIFDITKDISKNIPMIRLLNGDVGSGKTIVAAIASLLAVKSGFQAVWMAPTEILAVQHYASLIKLFKNQHISIGLLTANSKLNNKNKIKDILNSQIIIGTHALIQENIYFPNPGLVVIDEEHRFGVGQRKTLLAKCNNIPHYLAMTATPIPRTLAYSVYADMDISIINEMPKGRKSIITRLVSPNNREKAYEFISRHLANGRQSFVICPLIQPSANNPQQSNLLNLERKSVEEEFKKLTTKIFPQFSIAMLHGKIRPQEKERIMADFVKNKINILVSTSVVEVGVDIPNANIMLIEDADRFGLAQLHQFRGRVGRGMHQSYCLLFSNNLSPKTQSRLSAMERYTDGFKLAEIDLSDRGPGEFIGSRQSGFANLKIARLTDTITLNKAKKTANDILDQGIDHFPAIKNLL